MTTLEHSEGTAAPEALSFQLTADLEKSLPTILVFSQRVCSETLLHKNTDLEGP